MGAKEVMLGKALLLMVGKEVFEFLVIDGAVRLIGRSAKRRNGKMVYANVSWDQIRKVMGRSAQQVSTQIVAQGRSIGETVKGVLPVTNNKLDRHTEALLNMVVRSQMQVEHLYNVLGMDRPEIAPATVDQAVSTLMAGIKGSMPVEDVEPTRVSVEPVQPLQVQPEQITMDDVQVAVASSPPPVTTDTGNIPLSAPSNWHQA
jgi:hypothetical protein